LFILPPHSPRLNGRVERAHRTHLDEFYAVYELDYHLPTLNLTLIEWERIYNHVRPHRALANLSPAEYIQTHYPGISPLPLTSIEPIQIIALFGSILYNCLHSGG